MSEQVHPSEHCHHQAKASAGWPSSRHELLIEGAGCASCVGKIEAALDKVEAVIRQQGARFDEGWWNRIKCSYYRFVDQNMRDNEAHEPHCCNKAPRK